MESSNKIEIIDLIDKLFIYFDDYNSFNIYQVFKNSDLPSIDSYLKINNHFLIEFGEALTKSLKYATPEGTNGEWFILTDKGLEAKNAGGHFAYLSAMKEQKAIEITRQNLGDRKLIHDLITSEFESGKGRKIKIWGYRLALATFISTLLITPLFQKIFSSKNLNNNQNVQYPIQSQFDSLKIELQKTQKQVEELKQDFIKDTTPKIKL